MNLLIHVKTRFGKSAFFGKLGYTNPKRMPLNMNIFLSYEFHERNKWIKELVAPLIESFGGKAIIGEIPHGNITTAVKDLINASNGVIAFHTAQGAKGGMFKFLQGKKNPEDEPDPKWIITELTIADGKGIPAVLMIDESLDPGKVVTQQDVIYHTFNRDKREELMLKIAGVRADWKVKFTRQLVLIPKNLRDQLGNDLANHNLRCSYQFKNPSNGKNSDIQETELAPEGQGLVMYINNMPNEDTLVQIVIQGPTYKWSSGFVSLKSSFINLEQYERNNNQ